PPSAGGNNERQSRETWEWPGRAGATIENPLGRARNNRPRRQPKRRTRGYRGGAAGMKLPPRARDTENDWPRWVRLRLPPCLGLASRTRPIRQKTTGNAVLPRAPTNGPFHKALAAAPQKVRIRPLHIRPEVVDGLPKARHGLCRVPAVVDWGIQPFDEAVWP